MVIPGMGVDPAKLAAMQEVSKFIEGVIRIDYAAKSVSLTMSSAVSDSAAIIPELLSQLGGALAQQLTTFFAIKGEIIEVNKPDAQG